MNYFYFTFGTDHVHPKTGESLGKKYIRITGDVDSARRVMFHLFGRNWAAQYGDEGLNVIERYELEDMDWPVALRQITPIDCACYTYAYRDDSDGPSTLLIVHEEDCPSHPRTDWPGIVSYRATAE